MYVSRACIDFISIVTLRCVRIFITYILDLFLLRLKKVRFRIVVHSYMKTKQAL